MDAKQYLKEEKQLDDADFMDDGMIETISFLMEEYLNYKLLQNVESITKQTKK